MKPSKAELAQLAQLVEKDLSRGRVSANGRRAIEQLKDHPAVALNLLELALAQAANGRAKEPRFATYDFLFGKALEALRQRINSGQKSAVQIAEMVRWRLLYASREALYDPSVILSLLQSFGSAKLDLGAELQAVAARLQARIGGTGGGDPNPTDLVAAVVALVAEADADAFALFSLLAENAVGVTDAPRAAMAAAFLNSGHEVAAEAALGWLLDRAATVRRSVAAALADCAEVGKVSPTMLRRMITMRNWMPNDDARFTLVAAIAAARRRGLEPAPSDAADVHKLAITGVDGSGTIGIVGHCRDARKKNMDARKNMLAVALLKHGSGVSDAWARSGVTAKDIRSAFGTTGATGQFAAAPDFVGKAVGHFLAVGHQTGTMPPFGLIRFLEAVGLAELRSEAISPISLLNAIKEGRAISPAAFKALLAKGGGLEKNYRFLQSWFEVGDTVNALLTRNPGPRRQREALILAKVIEPRRQWWLQAAAWSAYILYRAGTEECWHELFVAAAALAQGRPMDEIPLMSWVARQTCAAWEEQALVA